MVSNAFDFVFCYTDAHLLNKLVFPNQLFRCCFSLLHFLFISFYVKNIFIQKKVCRHTKLKSIETTCRLSIARIYSMYHQQPHDFILKTWKLIRVVIYHRMHVQPEPARTYHNKSLKKTFVFNRLLVITFCF